MHRRFPLLLALICSLAHAPAAGAQAAAEDEVRAVVDRLFDAMRRGDSTAVRSLFHPEARLMSVGQRQGETVLRTDSIAAFVRAVGSPRDVVWDERVSDVEVRVDQGLATAWMRYRFYAGERFSHCGVNAFQLFRDRDGWRIVQITDTRRRDGCEP